MRLIDADALVEAIKDYPYGFRGMIVCDIAKQPTIEPKRDIHLHTTQYKYGYEQALDDIIECMENGDLCEYVDPYEIGGFMLCLKNAVDKLKEKEDGQTD